MAEKFDEALEKAQRARRGAPKDLQVLQELGLIYAQMNRLEEARSVFEEYLNLKQNVNVSILLANVLRRMGRIDEGRALIEKARHQEPDHGGVLITLGDFLVEAGRLGEALLLYQRAKEVDPYRASETANQRIVELRTQ
ncbi:MAG TPA: tetratricopeptide repeat protein [Vicinamibacteria bacterium]|nr:tetratricopeptide repeat protein [Vicinamibacteria bacterium]